MNLKEQVEAQLPKWRRWYPSLFEAARDLGIIRAQVCNPSSLLLSNRHAGVRQDAANAHREKWGGTHEVQTSRQAARRSKSMRARSKV